MISDIMQLPPAEAIEMLASLFEGNPEMLQLLEQVRQLPEAEQMEAIADLLEGIASANL